MTKKQFENFKTVLLNVLVLTSLFLTWQIWTFEPEYEKEAAPTEASPVGIQDVNISDVVKPNQLVYHMDNQHFTSFNSSTINDFYANFISGVKIKSFTVENDLEDLEGVGDSVELIFPTLLSNDVLKKLVSISKDDIPLSKFDRIVIPSIASGKNNEIVFLNTKSQVGMRATIEASSEMKEWYANVFSSFDIASSDAEEMEMARAKELQVSKKSPIFYLPIQGQTIASFGGSTDELANEEDFKEALFPEQDTVEKNSFNNISDLYTDGSRDLTFNYDNEYMIFKNPPSTTREFVANESPILDAYGFVNKHFGFRITDLNDDKYILSEWVTSSKNNTDQISFRLYTEGYPVYSSSTEDLDEINVTLENNDVTTYKRMLKIIQYTKEINERQLPGYEDVVALLEEGSFKTSEIQNMTIGYTIDRSANQTYDFSLIPQWFVKLNGTWTPLQTISNEQGG
ncbi:YycH family regulatory protein [Bacillus sp. RAR_GA_16]|uniref:YycH family regulatory protein n=1 Tax=Bacillus sp. RAR_GA_16 TaxID=2876774 RepID=UPI001CD02D8D|nr:two-component system activity regulator YycH [Bacillus sp. RAR_GA_16]MCA0170722.1 two-component system activity regulator YycH [Bacillus sp. RAR_GA_16]